MTLLQNEELENSAIVANNAMNRERGLTGSNGYERDLKFRIVQFIKERLRARRSVRWLDLCCGRGKALIEAGKQFQGLKFAGVGVDLVDFFDPIPDDITVSFKVSSVEQWNSVFSGSFDLITCCHGLHYVGDKLRMIERACLWIKCDGLFLANLDPSNIELGDEADVRRVFEMVGLSYTNRDKVLKCLGYSDFRFPYDYLGADDSVGPNYTGQGAVTSHYAHKFLRCKSQEPIRAPFVMRGGRNECALSRYHDGPHRVGSRVW